MRKHISLPKAPTPVGAYEACVIRQGIGFISGQFPIKNGRLNATGVVGETLSLKEAEGAMELAALNALAQVYQATDEFRLLDGLLRLDGYVASASNFHEQPTLLDVASKLFLEVLGEKGRHSRTAFAVTQLPLLSPIELCLTFAVKSQN